MDETDPLPELPRKIDDFDSDEDRALRRTWAITDQMSALYEQLLCDMKYMPRGCRQIQEVRDTVRELFDQFTDACDPVW